MKRTESCVYESKIRCEYWLMSTITTTCHHMSSTYFWRWCKNRLFWSHKMSISSLAKHKNQYYQKNHKFTNKGILIMLFGKEEDFKKARTTTAYLFSYLLSHNNASTDTSHVFHHITYQGIHSKVCKGSSFKRQILFSKFNLHATLKYHDETVARFPRAVENVLWQTRINKTKVYNNVLLQHFLKNRIRNKVLSERKDIWKTNSLLVNPYTITNILWCRNGGLTGPKC